jgi:zinc transport system substrate-binding protein
VASDAVAATAGDALERRLERRVLERLDLAAVVADEVMVMLAARVGWLEPGHAVSEIDPLHEAELIQPFECPIDASDPNSALASTQAVVDLLRRDTAILPAEELDDGSAGTATPSGCSSQARQRALCPGRCHGDNDTRSQRHVRVGRAMRLRCLAVLSVLTLAGCGGSGDNAGKQTVVVAFYPLAWAAEQIGGDAVDVENLTPPGAEPHDIELTPRDVEEVRNADLVLYLGKGFQPALEKAVESRSGPSLDLLAGQDLASAPKGEEELAVDPHVWLDPPRFARMVMSIGSELHREDAAARLADRLHRLDDELRTGLRSCRRNEIVTSHAAFGYLAQRYGLQQVPLTGVSPEAEPSPRDLQALIDEVKKSGATTVFFETLVSPRLAQTVAREAGARTAVLDPIEGLTKDEVAAGGDYLSVMHANLAALRKALACR